VPGAVDSAASHPVRMAAGSFGVKRRWMAIAAAAGIVLGLAGVAHQFGRALPSPEKPAGPAPVQARPTASASASAPAKPAITSAPSSRRTEAIITETGVSGGSTRPATPVAASHPTPPVPQVEDPKGRSWPVQHLHRFGSCAGLLGLSRKGLIFTPDDKSSRDAFTLTHDEYLPSSDGDTLTIKSNTKTYRFRVSTDGRTADSGAPLVELTTAIARFR
jgi:hypothetical protein